MLKALFGKGQDQGFTLIELLIVVLIIGILAAVAAPLYLGYLRDARMSEGKAHAGSLWTSLQANGVAGCGATADVNNALARAGFNATSATTPDDRWIAGGVTGTVNVNCTDGTMAVSDPVFYINANTSASDINGISIRMNYDTTNKKAQLYCQADTGAGYVKC